MDAVVVDDDDDVDVDGVDDVDVDGVDDEKRTRNQAE